MLTKLKTIFMVLALLLIAANTNAGQKTSNVMTGAWNAAGTWLPSGAPGPTDTVTITAGHTITINVKDTVQELIINGTLQFEAALGSLSLNVSGSTTINNGGSFLAVSPTSDKTVIHTLNITKNLTVNGTLSTYVTTTNATTGQLSVLMQGTGISVISGNPITFESGLSIDKAANTDMVQLQTPVTMNSTLTVKKGVLNNSNNLTINDGKDVNYYFGATVSAKPTYAGKKNIYYYNNDINIKKWATGSEMSSGEIINTLNVANIGTDTLVVGYDISPSKLVLNNGIVNTGVNTLSISDTTSAAITRANGYVIGNLARNIGRESNVNYLFPIGTSTYYRPIQIIFSTTPNTSGYLTANFNSTPPDTVGLSALNDNGAKIISIAQDGYWQLMSGVNYGANYSIILTASGFVGISDVTLLHIIQKNNTPNWQLSGTHFPTTGTTSDPIVFRNNIDGTNFSNLKFAIATAASATTKFSTGNGMWNNSASWSPAGVPSANDTVNIMANHTITIDIISPNAKKLIIDGTLQFDTTAGNKSLTVDGSITINSGGKLFSAGYASSRILNHSLFFSGDLIVDGELTNRTTNIIISPFVQGAGNSIIGGTGNFPSNIPNFIINKSTNNDTLTLQVSITTTNFSMVKGVLKNNLTNNIKIISSASYYFGAKVLVKPNYVGTKNINYFSSGTGISKWTTSNEMNDGEIINDMNLVNIGTDTLVLGYQIYTKTLELNNAKIITNTSNLFITDTTENAISYVNGYVIGNLARKVGILPNVDYFFPVGINNQKLLQITFLNYRLLTSTYVYTRPFIGTLSDTVGVRNLIDGSNGYKLTSMVSNTRWEIYSDVALGGAAFTISATDPNISGINNANLRLVTRTPSIMNWSFIGNHLDGTGTTVRRTDIGSDYLNPNQHLVFGIAKGDNPLSVKPINATVPKEYGVSQNYPNPFNPSTTINYQIPENNFVTLRVYDILGKEIATLVNEEISAGYYQTTFDASRLAGGMYFYKLTAGKFSEVKKMMVVK